MKKRFEEVLLSTKRSGIEELLKWLEASGFYKVPASTRYHLAEEGGLVKHSLNVYEQADKLSKALLSEEEQDLYKESIIICSLLHDIGKHQYYNKEYYQENRLKSGKLGKTPYKKNQRLINVPHEISAIQIISQFIELTEEETWAILQHNGMYSDLKYQLQGNETKLQMIIHWADMWASRIIEK